ncbi:MAG: TolC family protein [Gemmatimonadales bacterium]
MKPHWYALQVLGGILSLSAATVPASAQQPVQGVADTLRLNLRQARASALRMNPALSAARLDTTIARGELRQASLFFATNPSVDLLGANGGNGLEAGVSQQIEVFGQPQARARAGRAGLVRATAGVADATRLTLGDVDRAFYQLYSATRRRRLANEVFDLAGRVADVALRQLTAGEISRLDYNLASIELGRTQARALSARREHEQATIELRRLLGVPAATPIEPVLDSADHVAPGDTTAEGGDVAARTAAVRASKAAAAIRLDVDSLIAIALAGRPDLAEREAAVRQADALATTAAREALPNIVVRGATEPRDNGDGRVFRPGIGLTIPLFNRNRGRVQAFRATARQADLQRQERALTIRAQVASAVAAYQAAATEAQVLETTVLGPARQNRRLVEVAYREGKVGLPELLLIRNQAIDAELDYWTAWLAERHAVYALAEATGTNLTMDRTQP